MTNAHQPEQDNIGYENTETRANQDDKENDRMKTTDTDKGEGNKPPADTGQSFDEDNASGLRSESGKLTQAGEEQKKA